VPKRDFQMNYDKIDYGIKGFVRELNRKGFETLFSCAGHRDEKIGLGYITVRGCHNLDQLIKITRKYVENPKVRLSRLSWNIDNISKTMRATDIAFRAKNLTKSLGWDGESM